MFIEGREGLPPPNEGRGELEGREALGLPPPKEGLPGESAEGRAGCDGRSLPNDGDGLREGSLDEGRDGRSLPAEGRDGLESPEEGLSADGDGRPGLLNEGLPGWCGFLPEVKELPSGLCWGRLMLSGLC